jgi:outer membrane receptor protein involved in Fe transport
VTLDGVPLNDPFGGWVLWSQVAPESLESLDIVRGAGAGPYGAGALTGVIALRERDHEGGMLDASIGEDGGRRLAAATTLEERAGRDHRFGAGGSFGRLCPGARPRAGAADTPLDLDTKSAALRADIGLDALTALSLRASAYDEDRGSGLLNTRSSASGQGYSATLSRTPSKAPSAGAPRSGGARATSPTRRPRSWPTGRPPPRPTTSMRPPPRAGAPTSPCARAPSICSAGGWSGSWAPTPASPRARPRSGSAGPRRSTASPATATPGGETSVVGGYAEGSWTGGPWLVAGGLRLDQWKNANGHRLELDRATGAALLDETYADRSGEVTSARLAVRRDLGSGWAARAAAYSGFRPATINELHRPFRVGNDITESNPDLEPERLQGVETGLSWEHGTTTFGATLFWNRIEDAIVNVTIGTGPGVIAALPRGGFVPAGGVLRQRQNAGTIEATGVELNAEQRWDRITLTAAVSWTDAELDGGTAAPQLTGLRPAQAPEWSATAGIDWRTTDRLTLSSRARYESARFDDDLNSRTLDAALTLDARADYGCARA